MKDSDSTGRSNKKANGRTTSKLSSSSSSSSSSPNKGSSTAESKGSVKKQTKKAKAMMGGINSREANATDLASNRKSNSSGSSSRNSTPRKSNKQSPELRPRRRASQTYFFKYQLAKNPLKAEEEDLKLALLASLQQCSNGTSSNDDVNNHNSKSKNNKLLKSDSKLKSSESKGSVHSASEARRPVGRPKTKKELLTIGNGVDTTYCETKKDKCASSKKGQQYKICANSTSTQNGNKRRGSVESSLSSRESNFKDEEKVKKKKKFQTDSLLANCNLRAIDRHANTEKPRSKVKSSLSSCNDPTSVQNKIKKAKKLLQNKEANKIKSAAIIDKYTALKKFPSNSNSSSTSKVRGESLLSPSKNNADKSKSKTKLNNCYQGNNLTTASSKTTSKSQYLIPYSPYTPLQMKEPPDEDYLKKYKPETEDFLTFICFRTTAPNYQNRLASTDMAAMNGIDDNSHTPTNNSNIGNDQIIEKSNDTMNLKQCTSSLMKLTNLNNSPLSIDHCSPNNHRRPIRQSPRLASSSRKISENDSSNHNMGTTSTAYDNSINYEEDMKRASIALEDMAQEINSSDDINDEVVQNSPDCISKSSSPFKNNKHLVKGLMTREFAGAFADEETIFESISNHKL